MNIQKWFGILAIIAIVSIGLIISNNRLEKEQADTVSTSATTIPLTRDDIVGQWRSVISNPAHKNTLARRYMRHTFFPDGKLVVENEENSSISYNWEYDNGVFVVTYASGTSKFIEHFKLTDHDNLSKILFQSIVDGKPLANYNPEEMFVKQGSSLEGSMKIIDVFQTANNAMDFIDPKSLSVGMTYILSNKTPIMPNYKGSDFAGIVYAQPGHSIKILKRKPVNNVLWYRVATGDREGWVNSVALFGQKLK